MAAHSICPRWLYKPKTVPGSKRLDLKPAVEYVFLDTSQSLLGIPYLVVFLTVQVFILMYSFLMKSYFLSAAIFTIAIALSLWIVVILLIWRGHFVIYKETDFDDEKQEEPMFREVAFAVFVKMFLIALVIYECCLVLYSHIFGVDIIYFVFLGIANMLFWAIAVGQSHIINKCKNQRKKGTIIGIQQIEFVKGASSIIENKESFGQDCESPPFLLPEFWSTTELLRGQGADRDDDTKDQQFSEKPEANLIHDVCNEVPIIVTVD